MAARADTFNPFWTEPGPRLRASQDDLSRAVIWRFVKDGICGKLNFILVMGAAFEKSDRYRYFDDKSDIDSCQDLS